MSTIEEIYTPELSSVNSFKGKRKKRSQVDSLKQLFNNEEFKEKRKKKFLIRKKKKKIRNKSKIRLGKKKASKKIIMEEVKKAQQGMPENENIVERNENAEIENEEVNEPIETRENEEENNSSNREVEESESEQPELEEEQEPESEGDDSEDESESEEEVEEFMSLLDDFEGTDEYDTYLQEYFNGQTTSAMISKMKNDRRKDEKKVNNSQKVAQKSTLNADEVQNTNIGDEESFFQKNKTIIITVGVLFIIGAGMFIYLKYFKNKK